MNALALLVAAVAAFLASTIWYIAFARERLRLLTERGGVAPETRAPPWKMVVEILRSLVVAAAVALLLTFARVSDLAGALSLALVLWIGFPVVLLTGSVIWENVPPKLAAIHAGDWLIKLLLVAAILGAWH
jgi:uncharacterized protein DUF1761